MHEWHHRFHIMQWTAMKWIVAWKLPNTKCSWDGIYINTENKSGVFWNFHILLLEYPFKNCCLHIFWTCNHYKRCGLIQVIRTRDSTLVVMTLPLLHLLHKLSWKKKEKTLLNLFFFCHKYFALRQISLGAMGIFKDNIWTILTHGLFNEVILKNWQVYYITCPYNSIQKVFARMDLIETKYCAHQLEIQRWGHSMWENHQKHGKLHPGDLNSIIFPVNSTNSKNLLS